MAERAEDPGRTEDPGQPDGKMRARRALVVTGAVFAVAALAIAAFFVGRAGREDPETPVRVADEADPTVDPLDTTTTSALDETVPSTSASTVPSTVAPTSTTPPIQQSEVTGHEFPVRPASATSYARSHHDYPAADMFAPCGSDVVAVVAGVVEEVAEVDRWPGSGNDPALRGGLSVSVVGDDGVRYYGSHLQSIDPAAVPGARVSAGQRLGAVGETGNARGTGCHLHFGISRPCGPGDWQRRRGELAPQPYLDAWRGGQESSPTAAIAARPPC